jgi:hypothetical protein
VSYESWRISYQSSEQAARAAYDELATLRAELDGAAKSRNAAMLLYESARQSRDDLVMQQHEWQEALRTLDSERAVNALMTEEMRRIESCLRYEQHLAERIGTHEPGCEMWGPAHYECAVRALKAAESRAERCAKAAHDAGN